MKKFKESIRGYFTRIQKKALSLKRKLKKKEDKIKEDKQLEVVLNKLPPDVNKLKHNSFEHDPQFNYFNFWKCEMEVNVNEIINDSNEINQSHESTPSNEIHIESIELSNSNEMKMESLEQVIEKERMLKIDIDLCNKNRMIETLAL